MIVVNPTILNRKFAFGYDLTLLVNYYNLPGPIKKVKR